MYKSLLAPFIVGGAFAGATWYIWYHLVFTANSNKSALSDHFFGYAIYGMFASAFFLHPRHYWAGFLAGGLLGLVDYFIFNCNYYTNKQTQGFYVQYGNLTEEQRQKQQNWDRIYELSQFPQVKYGQLEHI